MADPLDELFARLSREPDFDAPELQAHDATDRLLLQTAAAAGYLDRDGESVDEVVAVIGDRHGALTLGAATLLGATRIRVHQDPLLGERALAANAARLGLADVPENHPLDASLLEGARLVLLQLPRSLAELDEIAQAVARWADPEVVLLAGGRVKHMTLAMNEVLSRSFGEVTAGLAARKSRVLRASEPRPADELGDPRFPVWGRDPDLPFAVAAFGATFGGATLDHGSRLLLRSLREDPPDALPEAACRILDLGCGNGVLAVSAALALPAAHVVASDQSAAAVAATRLTAEAAGVLDRVEVHRADATEAVQRLKPIAAEAGLTMPQLAIAWVLQNPNVAAALVGASRPEQLADSVQASGVALEPDLLAAIDAALGDAVFADPEHTYEVSPKRRLV